MWYPKGFKLKIGFTLSDFHIFFHTHPTLKKAPFAKCVKSLFQEHIEIHLFNLQGVGPHGKILRRWCWDSHLLFPTYAFSFLKKFPHICLFFFPISPKFSVRTNLFWFNLHLCIWKTLKAKFLKVSKDFLSSLTSLSSHFQWWDKSCFCKGYHLDNVLKGLVTPIIACMFL